VKLMLTIGGRCDHDFNLGSHTCEPSTHPIKLTATYQNDCVLNSQECSINFLCHGISEFLLSLSFFIHRNSTLEMSVIM